jgi:ankyrin repeat protein
MDQPTRGEVKEVLQKLGKGMEGLQEIYNQAMERIEGHTDVIRSLAKRILTWITHAKRPLSIKEIQHALAVREHMTVFDSDYMPDTKYLKSVCAGLVTTDEESGIIRLVHYTTQEFFQQSQEKWFPEGESYLTNACLTYLSFSTFEIKLCQTKEELEDRLRLNPFYGYAAYNWGHHARKATTTNQAIMKFLEGRVKMEASAQALTEERRGKLMPRRLSWADGQRDSTQMTGLHLAAYFGIERTVIDILQSCKSPDLKDLYGRTPLSWAAENGHLRVVEQLLATRQVEADSEDGRHKSPLIWAAKGGHVAIVRLLLDEGADFSLKADNERTPLSYAAENGHIEIVELLLDRGADIEFGDESRRAYDKTPLSYAANQGHMAIVELLLDKGAEKNTDFANVYGRALLVWASFGGHKAVFQLLFDRVADREWKDEQEMMLLSLIDNP